MGSEPVRWIETQAPLPPAKEIFRFERDWTELITGEHMFMEAKTAIGATRTQAVHVRRNISRACATGARSGFTANASRMSPRIPRFATPSGCWRAL